MKSILVLFLIFLTTGFSANGKTKIFMQIGGQGPGHDASTNAFPNLLQTAISDAETARRAGYSVRTIFSGENSDEILDQGVLNFFIYDDRFPKMTKAINEEKNISYSDLYKKAFFTPPITFTKSNTLKALQSLQDDANSGRIKAGDQVVIEILAHGSIRSNSEKSHSIELADGSGLSLDSLIEVKNALEKNGVSLAIIDHSCHSGYSLALASKNTCVISAAGDEEGTGSLDKFISVASKSQNFETAFLEARKSNTISLDGYIANHFSASFPRISSPADQELGEAINYIFTRGSDTANKALSFDEAYNDICKTSKIVKLLNSGKLILAESMPRELREKFISLEELQSEFEALRLKALSLKSFDLVPGYNGARWGDVYSSCDLDRGARTLASREFEQLKLICADPKALSDLETYRKLKAEEIALRSKLQELYKGIVIFEREFYDKSYREIAAKSKADNPCRNFKF